MKGSPIQIVVPYWEMRPAQLEQRLDQLMRSGASSGPSSNSPPFATLTTFIPWQHFESDISHALNHLLTAVAERGLSLQLWVLPELGLPLPRAGIPKDLAENAAGTGEAARDEQGHVIRDWTSTDLPAIPNLFSGEILNRYFSYLKKLQLMLADMQRQHPRLKQLVTLVLSSSYWKALERDRSKSALSSLRREWETMEGTEKVPDATRRAWALEKLQQSFRAKVKETLLRDSQGWVARDAELWIPDLDPAYATATFLSRLVGGRADFSKLDRIIDGYAGTGSGRAPWVYWSSAGSTRTLSDAEKQFLILKSALLMGARGGGVLIEDADWLRMSMSFRAKSQLVETWGLMHAPRAGYRVPRRELSQDVFGAYRQTLGESIELLGDGPEAEAFLSSPSSRLLVIDASTRVSVEQIERWAHWVQSGRVLVCPSDAALSAEARAWIEQCFKSAPIKMDMNVGVHFQIAHLGEGKWVWVDASQSKALDLRAFARSMAQLAGIEKWAESGGQPEQGRVPISLFPCRDGDLSGGHALFVFNPSRKIAKTEIRFAREVDVTDLITRHPPKREQTMQLEVPPFGILPLYVNGLDQDEVERWVASQEAAVTRESIDDIASMALPGFDPLQDDLGGDFGISF